MSVVYLLTYGDGDYGNEWGVISIHETREGAEAQRQVEIAKRHPLGSEPEIEEWDLYE